LSDETAPAPLVAERALVAWREGTRTRAAELRSLNDWLRGRADADGLGPDASVESTADLQATAALRQAIDCHLDAAVDAANQGQRWWHRPRKAARLERAMSNLDAAEADLVRVAPADFVLGQMPSVLNTVQRHLKATDPRRIDLERITAELGRLDEIESRAGVDEVAELLRHAAMPRTDGAEERPQADVAGIDQRQRVVIEAVHRARCALISDQRGQIVSALRGASSAALREQTRLRSFRNVIVVTTGAMAALASVLAVIGWVSPDTIPMCFAPESTGTSTNKVTVVCPTGQSRQIRDGSSNAHGIDIATSKTTSRIDIGVIEILGMTAAAVAAAVAIRGVRGSSEPYGIPVALAVLKLPTGAVTAFLGLLLMRGGFVPGLSALDTSAQILAWAIIFGYAQQLFTRLVDQQAHTVLDDVRSGNRGSE
jgi:hypothetical protein